MYQGQFLRENGKSFYRPKRFVVFDKEAIDVFRIYYFQPKEYSFINKILIQMK